MGMRRRKRADTDGTAAEAEEEEGGEAVDGEDGEDIAGSDGGSTGESSDEEEEDEDRRDEEEAVETAEDFDRGTVGSGDRAVGKAGVRAPVGWSDLGVTATCAKNDHFIGGCWAIRGRGTKESHVVLRLVLRFAASSRRLLLLPLVEAALVKTLLQQTPGV